MTNNSPHRKRISFFEMQEEGEAFDASAISLIGRIIRKKTGERIPIENHQSFVHGRSWTHPANEYSVPGEMKTVGAQFTASFDDILCNNFKIVEDMITSIVNQLNDANMRIFYTTMSNICDENGQTIDSKGRPFPEVLMEALQKIELGTDRDGNPVMPEIHVGDLNVVENLKAMPPEYHAEIERIKAEKFEEARQAEADRLRKFARNRL